MADWVLVENNEIKEYHALLPQNWRNISGLNLLINDLPALKDLGWYPIRKLTFENDTHVDFYTIREEFQYTIYDDYVEELRIIYKEEYTPPPSQDIDYYVLFMTNLRAERDRRLAASDYTQLTDIQAKLTDEVKNQINTYRQALRDLPGVCMNQGIFDINQVIWPENVSISIN